MGGAHYVGASEGALRNASGRDASQVSGMQHKSIAFAERPRVKATKASDDVVAADMVCVGARILG